jgi:hypothetical protein
VGFVACMVRYDFSLIHSLSPQSTLGKDSNSREMISPLFPYIPKNSLTKSVGQQNLKISHAFNLNLSPNRIRTEK